MIDSLLALDEPTILEHRFLHDRMPMWPFVRWDVLLEAAITMNRSEARRFTARPGLLRSLSYVAESFRRSPLRVRRHFDVVSFGSTTGVSAKRDGLWFGRINDFFALEAEERTLVVDQSQDWTFRWPRRPRHVAFHDWIRISADLRRRFGGGTAAADRRAVTSFVEMVRGRLPKVGDAAFWARIAAGLERLAARLSGLHEGYHRLFDHCRPRVVFLEGASYGPDAYIVKWAREMGIKTGEFQHGAIVPSHHAYNLGAGLLSCAEYRAYLPDYLLVYGAYWSRNVRTSSETVVVGNPWLTERLREVGTEAEPRRRPRLLVISQPDSSTRLRELAKTVAAELADRCDVVLRLHPMEAPRAEDCGRATVEQGGDLYESIAGSAYVVGVSSTALFEATAFAKPVFVLESASSRFYIPRDFAAWIRTPDELVRGMTSAATAAVTDDDYWASGWRERYRRFLEDKVRWNDPAHV